MTSVRMTLYVANGCVYIVIVAVLLCHYNAQGTCPHTHFTGNGTECCQKCAAGYGLIQMCSHDNKTVCEPCVLGSTFSWPRPHTERCRKCTECKRNQHEIRMCNTTHDTLCRCNLDFYWSLKTDECSLCKLCPSGSGAAPACGGYKDTVCVPCRAGTYSDNVSALSPCKPCSVCPSGQSVKFPCTANSDTICQVLDATHSPPLTAEELVDTTQTNFDVIPIYCAVLGAVIIGLLCYVMAKHYSHMRSKKRYKGHDPHEDIEYSKTSCGGDSGVYVEPDVTNKSYNQLTRIQELPPLKRQDIIKSLVVKMEDVDECKVFGKCLGYSEKKIQKMSAKKRDVSSFLEYLIADWSKNRHATIGVFIKILMDYGRPDVAKILQSQIRDVSTEHVVHVV